MGPSKIVQQLDWALGGGAGWEGAWGGVLRGKEEHCGIWRQAPWAQILTPGSLGPFISTRNPRYKPCPRRTVPLRLWWAGPAISKELTLAVFQPSKLQAQTGSESLQENASLPALREYSRTTLGAPGGGVGGQDFARCRLCG